MAIKPQKIQLDISIWMILKLLGVVLGLIFLYMVRDILLVLFVSFIIASAITPWVDWLEDRKVPRFLSVLGIYLVLIGLVALAFIIVVPPISVQLGQLASNLPNYYNEISGWLENLNGASKAILNLQGILESWTQSLASGTSGVFSFVGSFVGAVIMILLVFVITFYITLQKDSVKKFVQSLTPTKYQPYAIQLTRRIQDKMGSWITGQLILCLVIGVMAYIALAIMGVKYALVLAVFAGITEIIPYVGPWIGAVPAVFIAFLQNPILGLITLIVFVIVIQQIENSFVVPVVMKKAVGLNPIVTIVAIAIGGQLAGVAGAIIAIPLAAVISILGKDLIHFGKEIEEI